MTKKLYLYGLVVFALPFYSKAQYCLNVGPSSTIDSNVESVSLVGESATTINYSGCPGVTGLEDLTSSQSVSLTAGNSYTINIQFGTCGNNFSGAGEAWIDFNGNQIFENFESLGTWTGTPPTSLSSFNFTVPTNCANGAFRLRVMHWEGGSIPLNPCGTFSWGSVTDFEVLLSGGTGASGYCMNVGPSNTADSNLESFYLAGDGGTSINFTGCPGVVGLNDQTSNQSVNLGKNYTYQADVTFGTCGGSYNGAGEAWIDYDQNGTFDPGESIGTWSGNPPMATVFSFTVPPSAVDGTTRMRVIQQEAGSLPLDPCATYTWGSATDFEVVIGQGIDCSAYIGDSIQDPRVVSTLPYQEDYSNQVCYTNNVTVYNSPDVFYRLVPADYGVIDFNVSLCGSQIDTYLQLQDKQGNILKSNDDYCGTSSEMSFSSIGYDTLYVVVQGYSNESGDYSISINDGAFVSTKEPQLEVNIYPNPTSNGSVNITYSSSIDKIKILNMNMQLVQEILSPDQNSVVVDGLSKGVYFVEIQNGSNQMIKKLIVQ